MLNFGDIVQVKAFPNEILTRRVVGDNGANTVYLCNETEFQTAQKENRDPVAVGFPVSDVIKTSKSDAVA